MARRGGAARFVAAAAVAALAAAQTAILYPSNLNVTAGDGSITLGWLVPNTDAAATGFSSA